MIISGNNRKLWQGYGEKWVIVKNLYLLDKERNIIGKLFFRFINEEEIRR